MLNKQINRRVTFRFPLNTHATLQMVYHSILNEQDDNSESNSIQQEVILETISYRGMSITFSDDNFLYQFQDFIEQDYGDLYVVFSIDDIEFRFGLNVKWTRFYSIGERWFYVSVGLLFNEELKDDKKEELLQLLLSLDFDRVYLGHSVLK